MAEHKAKVRIGGRAAYSEVISSEMVRKLFRGATVTNCGYNIDWDAHEFILERDDLPEVKDDGEIERLYVVNHVKEFPDGSCRVVSLSLTRDKGAEGCVRAA